MQVYTVILPSISANGTPFLAFKSISMAAAPLDPCAGELRRLSLHE
jgi:hypothetical protein